MRAKFLSQFIWQGLHVYSYLDLDSNDIVWLKDGRHGEELKRRPQFQTFPQGRAIDFLPR